MNEASFSFDGVRLRAGDVDVYCVPDIDRIAWPVQAMFKDLDADAFRRLVVNAPSAANEAGSHLLLSFNSYIVDAPDYLCLIDAGVGNGKERLDRPAWHRRNGDFLNHLSCLGFAPDDFDIVINTHLHADHVGWNTQSTDNQWQPTFRNARYVVPAGELDFWRGIRAASAGGLILHGAYEDSIKPLLDAGRYEAVALPCEVAPGLRLEAAPGHTSGMAIVWLSVTGGDEIVFASDVVHSPIQLQQPLLTSNFCSDPQQAQATRARLLERCAASGALIAPYHFPPPVYGHIVRKDAGYAFRPIEQVAR
jgi:glyoxylase-like metal-dependent hydrolase (beta-lactamase superfamily II)